MPGRSVAALLSPQWRPNWDLIDQTDVGAVPRSFLVFVMKASELRRLSGVYRRSPRPDTDRTGDDSVQRPHEVGRSREIRRYVDSGYPLSTMSPPQLRNADAALRRPGWLPTAVVVNILAPGDEREGLAPLNAERAVTLPDLSGLAGGDVVTLNVPTSDEFEDAAEMTAPFEVIDGQHRLWAFEGEEATDDYFLPVVAFAHLSKAHQAYIFWTINIKPKKINTSLAFDLYPLLRSQEWLLRGEGLRVYREARAQELTEALWATPSSPWYDRINMIGSVGNATQQPVSQASFVRALQASFIKPWGSTRGVAGGLFGSADEGGLDWNRRQQAAFLINAWQAVVQAVKLSSADWWEALACVQDNPGGPDPLGKYSMLASDQGVRAFHLVLNDVSYVLSDALNLQGWRESADEDKVEGVDLEDAVRSLAATEIREFLADLASAIALFDWRTGRTPGLTDDQARSKAAYRGSGGYVALRFDLYAAMSRSSNQAIADTANTMLEQLPTGITGG